jgi:hypothetical protein
MKAETTRRPCLRMRQNVAHEVNAAAPQVAFSTLATAALTPSWASEITSLTLRKQRRASLRRNAVQKASASGGLAGLY